MYTYLQKLDTTITKYCLNNPLLIHSTLFSINVTIFVILSFLFLKTGHPSTLIGTVISGAAFFNSTMILSNYIKKSKPNQQKIGSIYFSHSSESSEGNFNQISKQQHSTLSVVNFEEIESEQQALASLLTQQQPELIEQENVKIFLGLQKFNFKTSSQDSLLNELQNKPILISDIHRELIKHLKLNLPCNSFDKNLLKLFFPIPHYKPFKSLFPKNTIIPSAFVSLNQSNAATKKLLHLHFKLFLASYGLKYCEITKKIVIKNSSHLSQINKAFLDNSAIIITSLTWFELQEEREALIKMYYKIDHIYTQTSSLEDPTTSKQRLSFISKFGCSLNKLKLIIEKTNLIKLSLASEKNQKPFSKQFKMLKQHQSSRSSQYKPILLRSRFNFSKLLQTE